MAITIETIEDAIITQLETLIEDEDFTVKIIKTYQGELESSDIERISTFFPAIYIVYGGSYYEDHGSRRVEFMTFHLLVCDKNLRAEEEARRGGDQNPGTYTMLDFVRESLYGQQLGLQIYPLKLISQTSIWFGNGISVYGAQYETAQALLYPTT